MPDDRIVVLSMGAGFSDNDYARCVHKWLARKRPDVHFVAPDEFRDAVSSSRWPFPESEEEARRLMADPVVRDAVTRLEVRYVIGVSSKLTSKMGGPGLGWVWASEESTATAHIWDLKGVLVLGSMIVVSSGTPIGVGIAPGCGLASVMVSPMHYIAACRALARHLAEFLGGENLHKPNQ